MNMRYLILLLLLFSIACQKEAEPMQEVTGAHVADLEQTACNAADEAGTCTTKLAALGFITKEDCCAKYQKCC